MLSMEAWFHDECKNEHLENQGDKNSLNFLTENLCIYSKRKIYLLKKKTQKKLHVLLEAFCLIVTARSTR